MENMPKSQVLVASNHQSAWETVAFTLLLDDPVFIVKRELFWVPVIGWVIKKLGHVGVKRKSGMGGLAGMMEGARKRSAEGRNFVIFPEGTRRSPDEQTEFKQGIGMLYRALDIPCLPVALNSGLFWPRRSWMRYPGTITVQILEPVGPGLDVNDFMTRIRRTIDLASRELVLEARSGNTVPRQADF